MSPLAFVVPAALGALGLLAVPVAVHMIRRSTARRLEFPSLRFLGETASRARRLTAPNRKVLLALRLLVVALVALAFARPVWIGSAAPGAAVAILVDASASMRRDEARSGAVEAARREIAALGPNDRVRVGAFDERVTWLGETGDANAALIALGRYEAGRDAAVPRAALDAASRVVAAMPAASRRVVLVSDFQQSNGPWDASTVDPSVDVRAVSVGAPYENAFVTSVDADGSPGDPRLAVGLVRASATSREAKTVVLPAKDGAASDGVRVSADAEGWTVAVVGADGFDADDAISVRAPQRGRVAVVDPGDPFVPAAAFAVYGDAVAEASTLDEHALEGATRAIVGQRALERAGATGALEAWVRAGGSAVVFAPAPAGWTFPSAGAQTIAASPVRVRSSRDDALDRAMLASGIASARAIDTRSGDEVVLRDAMGAPLAVRRSLDAGNVVVAGFEVNAESVPLVRDPSFPSFVAWLVETASPSIEVVPSIARAESEPSLMSPDDVARTVSRTSTASAASSSGSLAETEARQGLWRIALVAALLLALAELAVATRATSRGLA